jgi:hypothetical protein
MQNKEKVICEQEQFNDKMKGLKEGLEKIRKERKLKINLICPDFGKRTGEFCIYATLCIHPYGKDPWRDLRHSD